MNLNTYAPDVARPAGRLRWGAVCAAAAIVVVAFLFQASLTAEHTPYNVVAMAAFYALLPGSCLFVGCAMVFGLIALLGGLRVGGRSGGWLLLPAAIVAVALAADGAYEHLPTTRFRRLVADPMPASVTGLRFGHGSSFGEGYQWTVAFHISPTDFDVVRRSLDLREVPAPATQPAEMGAPDGPDRLLQRDARDLYSRPTDAKFYAGRDRSVVVTDGAGTTVYAYRNFWSDRDER